MSPPQLHTMAPTLTMLLFVLHILTASVLQSASEPVLSERRPHLTGCASPDMMTFRCRWNVGPFQNLSDPRALRLFYFINVPPPLSSKNWSECPHYSNETPNECFFDQNHTSIWTYYNVQLRSRDETILYDEKGFFVNDIVQPDPPVSLNWMLLNVDPVLSTQCSLYGLQTNINHEIRVRCKMFSGKEFGEFSKSVFIHIPSKVSRFPVVALLIFGALCLVGILMLIIISQQEKWMVILLPPVPGPKIKGIDSELLKSGKLRELTSILGGPPDLRPELYNSDPWMEFIDLDIEEQSDRVTELDTDCLMNHHLTSNCSPLSLVFRDDDSGRASCCDPDLPCDPEPSPFLPLVPNLALSQETLCAATSEPSSPIQSCNSGELPSFVTDRDTLYTQVSEVRSSGKVLLLPEEQTEGEKMPSKEKEDEIVVEKEKKEFQLLVMNADHRDYTSELNAGKTSQELSTGDLTEPCKTFPSPPNESNTTSPPPIPAPVYTVVEGVDRQNSLLLSPNSAPAPHLIIPKNMPTPDGYLTANLLGSITP
ncbi:growth hormone receptor-like isoform X3 [Neolamprologus brichardi]|uniref:growth hormone receptor-like isoform X3 n=1 Tax=Neolamprologus brichardi TaxID=32507 RepID=UPI0003EBD2B9|nr:growth hormone receptor-like isoform X3 [Neolamprologus brichardi]